jgi:hypothetical protein
LRSNAVALSGPRPGNPVIATPDRVADLPVALGGAVDTARRSLSPERIEISDRDSGASTAEDSWRDDFSLSIARARVAWLRNCSEHNRDRAQTWLS